jgi:hypothetical protein
MEPAADKAEMVRGNIFREAPQTLGNNCTKLEGPGVVTNGPHNQCQHNPREGRERQKKIAGTAAFAARGSSFDYLGDMMQGWDFPFLWRNHLGCCSVSASAVRFASGTAGRLHVSKTAEHTRKWKV